VGFAPGQPVTSTWVLKGQRKLVPHENTEGRRVNALAALTFEAAGADLRWVTKPASLRAEDVVAFLRDLPAAPVPTVAVVDNVGIHTGKVMRAARPALRGRGVYLYYLPPYSPELNAIEPIFRVIKHDELPERRYTSVPALTRAVDTGFANYRATLHAKSPAQPGLPA
jgi:hypothetical protein